MDSADHGPDINIVANGGHKGACGDGAGVDCDVASGASPHEPNKPSKNSHNGEMSEEDEAPYCPAQVGYRMSVFKSLLLYPLAALPLGAGLLLAYWFPPVWLRLTSWRAPLDRATFVIVKDADGHNRVERVRVVFLPPDFVAGDLDTIESNEQTVLELPDYQVMRYFTHRHLRYVYDPGEDRFLLLSGVDKGNTCSRIRDLRTGLSDHTHRDRLLHYGSNSIDVPVPPYYVLLIKEVLHPFYIFEVITVVFWLAEEYYYYAGAVLFITLLSVFISLIQTRRNLQQLHDLIAQSCTITVVREGKKLEGVASEDLVPGDLLLIPPTGLMMPCDAALISGHAIVNEAMLTGESLPVTKTPLPDDHTPYDSTRYKRQTLFNGTQVIQTRYYGGSTVAAVVLRTGFSTSKGGMVRSIMFPKPLSLKFYSDALKFVAVMSAIAFGGFVYSIAISLALGYRVGDTIVKALDVITIMVPPALPAALTVGTVYALNRLRKAKIYCISPQRVNLCGKIKLVCFDKTGTLTEDSLDMAGVRPVQGGMFTSPVRDPSELSASPLLHAMATCHSLTKINGELSGDPLDLKMFQSTNWVLEEAGEDETRFDSLVPTVVRPSSATEHVELGIMKQFTFSSELQRMSVLVRTLPSTSSSQYQVFVKGAPETIRKFCRPETVPGDFSDVLGSLTERGLRVLAVGYKSVNMPWHKIERLKRESVESELSFGGLIVMQNKLKAVTKPTLRELTHADIRTLMITGDNILTAISVAKECEMVPSNSRVVMVTASPKGLGEYILSYRLLHTHIPDLSASDDEYDSDEPEGTPLLDSDEFVNNFTSCHLAVDGATFDIIREHFPDTAYQQLLVKGTVFARMSPNQKAQLVSSLMSIGYGVCMCGDGANDCRALKMAHAGISLSETEASVASPFTSKVQDITCVPKLIKEGRAALVTSFSAFKYMALYCFAEFISAAILYAFESNLGDQQYLYIDLILVLAISFTMSFTGAHSRLVRKRPLGTLAGIHVLLSIVVHIIIIIGFQLGVLYYLKTRSWYQPLIPDPEEDNIVCQENTAIFQFSIFQYISLSIALSTAAPFRKSLLTNFWFMVTITFLSLANVYIILAPPHWVPGFWTLLQLAPFENWLFRLALFELALVNGAFSYFIEEYVLSSSWMRVVLRVVRCKFRPRNRYKAILSSIPDSWPPLTHQIDSVNTIQ